MLRLRWCQLAGVCLLFIPGCLPGVHVRPHPSARDPGIRYYRPKPYLLLSPVESQVRVSGKEFIETTATGEYVQMQLEYLPDFSEEYAITVTPGFGTADLGITLQDGWNLTKVSQDLDSQVDENFEAVADVVDAVAGIGKESGSFSGPHHGPMKQRWVVRASNVPLGYYEAVLRRDPCGQKRLEGWRYVGFSPFLPCLNVPASGDPTSPQFGLVFEQGVMTFKPLPYLHTDLGRVPVSTGISVVAPDPRTSSEVEAAGASCLPIRPAMAPVGVGAAIAGG